MRINIMLLGMKCRYLALSLTAAAIGNGCTRCTGHQRGLNHCAGGIVVAFGDSHTSGGYDDVHGKPTQAWAYYFARDLGLCLANHAVLGATVNNVKPQLPVITSLTSHGTLAVYMPGTNDVVSLGVTQSGINTYKGYLTTAITYLSNHYTHVLIGTNPQEPFYPQLDDSIPLYAQATRDVVTALNRSNIKLVDIEADFTPGDGDFAPGNFHFNQQGSQKIANLFKAKLAEF